MSPNVAASQAAPSTNVCCYQRYRPEHTLFYRIIAQHYPALAEHLAAQSKPLPDFVQQEFEDYLQCGRLEHGYLRVRCKSCHTETPVAFSCKRHGFCPLCGARRMVESAAKPAPPGRRHRVRAVPL